MICKKCGAKHDDNSKFCPECGAATTELQISENIPTMGGSSQNVAFTQPPIKQKKKKGCLIYVLIALGIIVAFSVAMAIAMSTDMKNNSDNVELPSGVESNEYSIVNEELTATDDITFAIFDIFEKCKIGTVTTFEYDNQLDNMYAEGQKGYRLTTNIASNIILYINSDGTVYALRYLAEDLYIDGNVVAELTDFIVLTSEASTYYAKCQTYLKDYVLKSPSTAEFPNITAWKFGKEDGNIIVQSYVDAQNSFGAMLRSEFQFIIDTETGTVTSLIFDGKELIQ